MAFNPRNDKITTALATEPEVMATQESKTLTLPQAEGGQELTKNYTFSLQPSARKKLDVIAKENGFKSSSKFLNMLIKGM